MNFSNLFSQDKDVQIWILSHVVTILSAVLSCLCGDWGAGVHTDVTSL